MLTVALLGPPAVELDGAPVTFDTRKAVAVLALLAAEPAGRARTELADLLWPDSDSVRSRSALRRTLSVLGAGVGGSLTSVGGVVRLDGAARVDVTEFRAGAANRTASVDELRRSAELWRGEFMAGFAVRDCPDFDDWQSAQAEALRREYGLLLDRLVAQLVAAEQLDAAVEQARRRLALDVLHEPAHQTLMRLYHWSGQRSAALRQYRDCVRVLDDELGVAPLADTTSTYEAICADTLPRPAAAAAVRPPERTAVRPRPAPDLLVGRDAELDHLLAALSQVPDRRPQVVCVLGPTGTGKSALLRAFTRSAADRGVRVLATRCVPMDDALPFATVRALLAQSGEATNGTRLGLSAALTQLVKRGGEGGVVVVDDAQWCDDSSVSTLRGLALSAPTLLVTAWDPTALDRPAAVELLAALAGAAGAVRLELSPLTVDDVTTLLDGYGLPTRLAAPVHRSSGGVPLLVTEHLRSLTAAPDGSSAEPDLDLPSTAALALRAHLARVSDTCAQLVTAAAVLGRAATPDLLQAVSGRSDEETVDGIEEAVAEGLLVEAVAGYQLAHDLLRRVAYDAASLARRRLLHARAARALARRPSAEVDSGVVAYHFRAAGEDEEAAAWSWRAAQRARSIGANPEALAHLQVAGALGVVEATVHEATGDVLTALGRYRDAVAAYERAAAVGDGADGDGAVPAGIEHKLAEVYQRMGDWRVAEVHLAAALALVGDGDGPHRARLRADAALLAYRRDAFEDATALANAAMAEARSAGDDAALAQATDVLALLALHHGHQDDAHRLLTESLIHAVRAGDTGLRVAALNNLAHLHAVSGAYDEAVSAAREALAAGLEHGDKHHCAALHANLADALHRAGRDVEAREHLTEAATLFGELDERLHRPEIWKLAQW